MKPVLHSQLSWQAAWQDLPERKQLRPRQLRLQFRLWPPKHFGTPRALYLTWKVCRSQGQISLVEWCLKIKAYCGPLPLMGTSSSGNPIKMLRCRQHHQSNGLILMLSPAAYALCCEAEHLHHSELSVTAIISLCAAEWIRLPSYLVWDRALSISQRTSFKKENYSCREKEIIFVFLLFLH